MLRCVCDGNSAPRQKHGAEPDPERGHDCREEPADRGAAQKTETGRPTRVDALLLEDGADAGFEHGGLRGEADADAVRLTPEAGPPPKAQEHVGVAVAVLRIATNHEQITGQFALQAECGERLVRKWMEGEQSAADAGQRLPQSIPSAKVQELVQQDVTKVGG